MAIALGGDRCSVRDPRDAIDHAQPRRRMESQGSWTRPSPDTARRSGSIPSSPKATSLGNALIRQGKLDEASAAYREAIRLKPDDAEGHYGLGNALKGQGKLDEAIAEYREAIRLKPDHAEAHCNLGSALKGQGKLDEAIAGYREAIRLKPDYAEAHSNLGGILKSRGDDAGPWQCTGSGARSKVRPRPPPFSRDPVANPGLAQGRARRLVEADGWRRRERASQPRADAPALEGGRRIWPASATLRPWPSFPSPSGRNGNRSGATSRPCSSGPKGTPRRP